LAISKSSVNVKIRITGFLYILLNRIPDCFITTLPLRIFAHQAHKMTIRKGTKQDMPDVLRLITELARFEREPEAVVVTVDDLVRDGFGNEPLFYTFVAEDESGIIGMALYYYRFSTWKGKTIHLEDLIVTENSRGTGAGLALYSKIIEQGKIDNVRRIEWNVLDWNEPAVRFYEKSGAKILSDWRVVHLDESGMNKFLDNSGF